MFGKVKQKLLVMVVDLLIQFINEKILKECYIFYIDLDNGELIFFYFVRGGGLNIICVIL